MQALQDQVRMLEERLNQTSRNSSRPPSSDPPQSPRPNRPRSKRRRGGQPGHPGQTRTLIPVEDVDQIVPLKPEQCQGCQALLSGDDPSPFRHQVVEIPPIQPVVPSINGISWYVQTVVRRRAPPGPRAFPAAPMVLGCMPRWRCVRGRTACPSARPRRCWTSCLGCP